MCQLLGMNCNTPTDVTFSFTGFAQRGGRTDHHADGWGIAFFEDRGLRHFVDHQPACESPVAELIRRYPIKSRNVIAHIRKATQGAVNAAELPPLRARAVGPLLGVRAQRRPEGLPAAAARQLPSGGQHRQRARLLLDHAGAGQVARRRAQRGRAHAHAARTGAAARRHGTFNFMLSNGQALWAHASTQPLVHRAASTRSRWRSWPTKTCPSTSRSTPRRPTASPWMVTAPLTTNEAMDAVLGGRASRCSWTAAGPAEAHRGRTETTPVPLFEAAPARAPESSAKITNGSHLHSIKREPFMSSLRLPLPARHPGRDACASSRRSASAQTTPGRHSPAPCPP